MSDVAPTDPDAALWERLGRQRLALGDTVEVMPQQFRGRRWYLLRHALGGQQFRLSEAVYDVLAALDGHHTLAEILARHLPDASDDADLRQQLLRALSELDHAGMLVSDLPVDAQQWIARRRQRQRSRRLQRVLRLLSPRFGLFDPDALLAKGLPLVRWFFHPVAIASVAGVVLLALLYAAMNWQGLALYGAQRFDDPTQWLWLVALYPVVKALHEFGHGFAAKSAGAAVHEMGITLLVFVPVPYVDASAASMLPNKYRRMLVGAAGILVEGLLASAALFAWLHLADGPVRDAMFAVMLIGGVSTLLFNGNPLLRFDGYYVLADAVEIPNLATRAGRYYGYLARRYLLGLNPVTSPATARGERAWFLWYGAAATLYRIAIGIGIAFFMISVVPGVGFVLAAWVIAAQILYPLWRQIRFLLFSPALSGRRLRAWSLVTMLLATVVATSTLVPLPSSTTAEGIVLLPDEAIVRADVDGFVETQLVRHGAEVEAGDALFELRNRRLDTEHAVLEARVRELVARRDAVGIGDRVAHDIRAERLAEARSELVELSARRRGLTVRSPIAGLLRVRRDVDLQDRLVRQGEFIGFVADRSRAIVRVVATQDDAVAIRATPKRIRVRLADSGGTPLTGELIDEVPAASNELPSAALGSRGGGRIPVDARDERGLRTLHKVFAFDVAIPFTAAARYVGSRVSVRFEHAPEPLLARWYDSVRRLVLAETGS